MQWLPQNDILGHPKTKLFITHCGNNGQYEALYHAVPMLGFPLFAEQSYNCLRTTHKGLGLQMDIRNFSSAELVTNIREILHNPAYGQTAKKLSEIWRDEPLIGREKAVFWIEHVIKYGAEHLRSPAMDMSLSQFYMLDVIGIAMLVQFVAGAGLAVLTMRLLSRRKKEANFSTHNANGANTHNGAKRLIVAE